MDRTRDGHFTAALHTPCHTHTSQSNYPSPNDHRNTFTHTLAVRACFSRWVWCCVESRTLAAVFILVPSVGGPSTVFVQGLTESTITAVSGPHLTMIHVYFTFSSGFPQDHSVIVPNQQNTWIILFSYNVVEKFYIKISSPVESYRSFS